MAWSNGSERKIVKTAANIAEQRKPPSNRHDPLVLDLHGRGFVDAMSGKSFSKRQSVCIVHVMQLSPLGKSDASDDHRQLFGSEETRHRWNPYRIP